MQVLGDGGFASRLQNFLNCTLIEGWGKGLPAAAPEAQQWICGEEMEDRRAREVRELRLPVGTPQTPLPESFKGPAQKLALCCPLMEERQLPEPPAGTPPAWLP